MPEIITFTPNPALDVSMSVEEMQPEEKLRTDTPKREPGGGGVNVARALKRLCCPDAKAIYTSGGVIGQLYEQLLKDEELEQHPYQVKNNTRESIMVTDKQKHNLYRFVTPGGELEEGEWQGFLNLVPEYGEADYLVASGSLPPGAPDDFYARLSQKARERDIRLLLDTSGKALENIKNSGAYLLKPNKNELSELVGRELKGDEDYFQAAEEMIQNYDVEVLVVSLGAEGAILASADGIEKLSAPKVEKRSSVGAGDSMVAGIVSKLIEGKKIKQAVLYGLCCGSAAIMTPGSELLRKEDADKLYAEMH